MSMSAGPTRLKRWRPVEQAGYGAGCVAGGITLLLLWLFSLSSDVRDAASLTRPGRRPPASPGP